LSQRETPGGPAVEPSVLHATKHARDTASIGLAPRFDGYYHGGLGSCGQQPFPFPHTHISSLGHWVLPPFHDFECAKNSFTGVDGPVGISGQIDTKIAKIMRLCDRNCAARLFAAVIDLAAMTSRYEFLGDMRGKGLMIGIGFRSPRSLRGRVCSVNSSRYRCLRSTKFDPSFQPYKPYYQASASSDHFR